MFLNSLRLKNLLSFHDTAVELRDLNVVIGANGAGKSNLIDCVALLRALPAGINPVLLRGGGVVEWMRKSAREAPIEATLQADLSVGGADLRYELEFASAAQSLVVEREVLRGGEERAFFRREGARCEIGEAGGVTQVAPMDSVFGIYRNPADPTPITATAKLLESIRIYREFRTGAMDGLRAGTSASGPKHPLNEDGSNLALLLQDMEFCGSRRPVESRLRELLEQFERLLVNIEGGSVRLFLEERSLGKVSASRLSDGTLKFLCLMAILYDHAPPPLVCIEEPETGLHPEALRIVAAALRDASERMQLIVTTHSEALVSAFTGEPESVLVCEREFNEGTQFSRLSLDRLAEWLETYTLGELWLKGEIGGTRW